MGIAIERLSHVYRGPGVETAALSDVSGTIPDGLFLAIVGSTGSGKSTLIQHLNGLLRPTSGRVVVDGIDLARPGADLRAVRRRVGLVFQYPEHQLFEETVLADVAFGPRNLGCDEGEAGERAREALELVGLDPAIGDRSPFSLSGGQMRRVAIAGILAMRPQVLVLDEPTAGLDPRGRAELLDLLVRLHRERGITVILVSHHMEDVARCAEQVWVMHAGRLVASEPPRTLFQRIEELEGWGLAAPAVTQVMHALRRRDPSISAAPLTVAEARDEILRAWGVPRCSKG